MFDGGGYDVGSIEATLRANFDDHGFKKFDAAVARAKKNTNALADSQGKAATEMRLNGKSYEEIARKLNLTEKETKQLIRRNQELQRSERQGVDQNRRFGDSFRSLGTATKVAIAGVVTLAGLELPRLINAYRDSAKVGRQTEAVIKSTGGAANVTAGQVADLSAELSKKTGVDDELIQSGANLLLTFTHIRNEAGKGNDVFDQTTRVTLDLAKATGIDMTDAAKQLGKALNDPATGLTALRRSGASFNETQTETIKTLFESGKEMEAQKLILRELDKEFKGSAVAQGDQFNKLQVSIENVEEAMGEALFPVFSKVADEAEKQFGRIERILSNDKLSGEEKFGRILAVIERTVDQGLDKFEDALPEISEMGGRMGLRLAGSLVRGFLHAPVLGKLVIGAWLIQKMGGWSALAGLGGKAGKRIGTALMARFLGVAAAELAVEGAFGQLMGARFKKMLPFFRKWGGRFGLAAGIAFVTLGLTSEDVRRQMWVAGGKMGQWLVNAVIDAVNLGFKGINAAMDKANPFGDSPIHVPLIPKLGFDTKDFQESADKIGIADMPGKKGIGSLPKVKGTGQGKDINLPLPKGLTGKGYANAVEDPEAIMDGNEDLTKSFEDMGDQVADSTGKTQKKVTKDFTSIRTKASREQRTLQGNLRDSWRDIDQDHARRTKDMDLTTRKRFSGMRETVSKRGRDMVDSMSSTMGSLADAVNSGFGKIEAQTNKALQAFGVEPVSFSSKPQKTEKKAGGGFLAGAGLHDTVPVWAAPGEAFVNRHQQGPIEDALAVTKAMGLGEFGSLDELFSGVTTPHYMAEGGIVPVPGFPGESINSRVLKPALQFMERFGLRLTDAYGPGHESPEHTQYGTAIDVVPADGSSWNKVAQAAYEAVRMGWTPVGYDGRNGTEAWPGHGPPSIAGANAHAHITLLTVAELLAGQTPGGVVASNIRRQLLNGPDGALKAGGQGALDMVRKAAQKFVNRKSSMGNVMFDGPGSQDQVMKWLTMALKITGHYSPENLQALYGRAMQESGGDPKAINLWDSNAAAGHPSKGLLQTIDSTFDSYKMRGYGNIWNPVHNAIAAIRYMFAAYGHIVGPSSTGYEKGGRVIEAGAPVLARQGFSHRAAAAVFGNSYGESGWDTESIEPGTNNGGLFGFTSSPVSLPDMQAFAERMGYDWRSAAAQVQFMALDLKRRLPSTFQKMNDQTIPDATYTFMHEWERPRDYSSLGKRVAAGFRASKIMRGLGIAGGAGSGRSPEDMVDGNLNGPVMVTIPVLTGGVGPGQKPASYRITEEAFKRRKERQRRERAAFRKRWAARKKAMREGRKAVAGLPRFRNGLSDMPRFTDEEIAETMGFHEPMSGDLAAYQGSYDILDRIDPKLSTLRDQLVGSYDLDTLVAGKTLRQRYDLVEQANTLSGQKIERMRLSVMKAQDRDLKAGKLTLPPLAGGARPPKAASKKEIRAYYSDLIKKRAATIRAQTAARKKQIMAPVKKFRTGRQESIDQLTAQGEFFSDIIRQTRGQIASTRTAQATQGRAFFAQGGRAGVPAQIATPAGPVTVTVVLDDPVLAALNPQIRSEVNGLGKKTHARGRAAGGRKVVL